LDAANATTSSGTVTSWSDSNNNVTFTEGSSTPVTYSATGINGHPAVVFNGSSNYLQNLTYTNSTNGLSYFVIMKPNSPTNYGRTVAFAANGATDWGSASYTVLDVTSNGSNIQIERNGTGNNPLPSGDFLADSVWGTSGGSLYVSGGNLGTSSTSSSYATQGTTGNFNISQTRLGTGFSGGSPNWYWSGSIGEVVAYNATLTTTQREEVEQYLNNKWFGIGTSPATPTTGISVLPTTTPVTISGGGIFDLNGDSQQIGSLNSTDPTSSVTLGGGTLTIGGAAASAFAGTISGSGGLALAGGGLALTGSNIYSGPTTISGGTLQLGDGTTDGSISSSSGIINNSALVYNLLGSQSYTGAISGGGSLSKTGSGTLTLGGTNSYSGGTAVNPGTLEATTTASLPGYNVLNSVAVAPGGVLAVQTSGGATITAWNGAQIGSLLTSASWANSASVLGIDTSNGNFTYAGAITQAMGLAKLGSNTLTLTAPNTYSGNTLVSAGVLQLAEGNVIPSGPGTGDVFVSSPGTLDLNGQPATINALNGAGTVDNSAAGSTASLILGNNNSNGTFSGVIQNTAGTLSLTKNGGGIQTLSGSNTYTGGTTINGGTLQLGDGVSHNGYVQNNVADNSALAFANPMPQTFSSQITGSGNVTMSGPGMLALTSLSNSFTGTLTVSNGTLAVTKLNNDNGTGTITLGGGASPTLQFIGGNDDTSRGISLAGNAALDASGTSSGANFEMDGAIAGNGHNLTLAGTSSQGGELGGTLNLGSGSLTKTGSGLWALDVANTMAGVTINAGTLLVTSSANLGTGVLAFSGSGGTLDIEPVPGESSVAYADTRAIALSANGTILQDNTNRATLSGVISGGGTLTVTGAGNLILSGSSNSFGGTLVEAGMLTVTTIDAIPDAGLSIAAGGTFVFDPQGVANGDSLAAGLEGDSLIFVGQKSGQSPQGIAPVPEPGTLGLLLAAALCSAATYSRFRRRRKGT
jgi:autotransporter-associated beta strand protein